MILRIRKRDQVPPLDARERRKQVLLGAHLPRKKKTNSLPVPATFVDIEMSHNRPLELSDLQTPFHIKMKRNSSKPSIEDAHKRTDRHGQNHGKENKDIKGRRGQVIKKKSNGHRKEETDSLSITALYHKTMRQQMKTAFETGKPIPLI